MIAHDLPSSPNEASDDDIRGRYQALEMGLGGQRRVPQGGEMGGVMQEESASEWTSQGCRAGVKLPHHSVCEAPPVSLASHLISAQLCVQHSLRPGLAPDRRRAVHFAGQYRQQFMVIKTQLKKSISSQKSPV